MQALGRHQRPTVPDRSIPEIHDVSEALTVAAEERLRAGARDMSFEKEHEQRPKPPIASAMPTRRSSR